MKRRTFFILVGTGVAAVALPFAIRRHGQNPLAQPLGQPDLLGHVTDEATLREIGAAYCARNPDEQKEEHLVDLLIGTANDDVHAKHSPGDSGRILRQLDQAIRDDYAAGRVITLKGWVLSLTEARQCALYSLSH
jgi:hypothetical protein